MSVALIDAQELADAATLAALGAPAEARELPQFIPGVLFCLAKFSAANVAAYRRTYVEGRTVVSLHDAAVQAVTAQEIADAVRTIPPAELCSSFLNLHYNAVSNGGTDFLDASTAAALAAICAWAAKAKEELTPLPPGRRSKNDRRTYGGKYDLAKCVSDVPALVRADIKAAVARGDLPKATYSVRKRRVTHSWGIDVRVSNVVGMRLHNPERLQVDRDDPHTYHPPCHIPYLTPEADALIKTVAGILDAYNHDGSDSQTDYFDVRYYGGAEYDSEWSQARREIESAELPTRKAVAP